MLPMASIRIPNVLRHHTGGTRIVTVSASTVGAALEALFEQHPSLRDSTRGGGSAPERIPALVHSGVNP